jgi:uncharacterized repeat protein (TIGR01451 family)
MINISRTADEADETGGGATAIHFSKQETGNTLSGRIRHVRPKSEAIHMKAVSTGGWLSARVSSMLRGFALAALVPIFSLAAVSAANAANLTNTARAIGTAPGGSAGGVISNNSTVNIPVTVKAPSYTVAKSVTSVTTSAGATPTQPDAGDVITYSYVVDNTGNVSLNAVVLTDPGVKFNGGTAVPLTAGPTLVSGDTNSNNKIDTTEVWTYTATYTLTQGNVDAAAGVANGVSNTVSVTAKDPQGVSVAPTAGGSTLTATTTINSAPSLTIAKSATVGGNPVGLPITTALSAGDIITYSYLVTNNGNVSISGISVSETAFTGTSTPPSPAGGATSLAPGDTTTFTANYTVTQADIDALQ